MFFDYVACNLLIFFLFDLPANHIIIQVALVIRSHGIRGFDYLMSRKQWKPPDNNGKIQFYPNLGLHCPFWYSQFPNFSETLLRQIARETCT